VINYFILLFAQVALAFGQGLFSLCTDGLCAHCLDLSCQYGTFGFLLKFAIGKLLPTLFFINFASDVSEVLAMHWFAFPFVLASFE
jgi:hypothetical protein